MSHMNIKNGAGNYKSCRKLLWKQGSKKVRSGHLGHWVVFLARQVTVNPIIPWIIALPWLINSLESDPAKLISDDSSSDAENIDFEN